MNPIWITEDAVEWLESHTKPEMKVFEYGSGTSTLYFARRVKEVISVECYANRYEENTRLLKAKSVNSSFKITINLVESVEDPKPFPYSHESYNSTDEKFINLSLEGYVNHIKEYKNEFFDIILINGRSRASCIRTAIPKIKPGGLLILNDSERYEYQNAMELFLKKYPHQEFGEDTRKTGIWTID